MTLRFGVLGQLVVSNGDRPIALGSHKQRSFLALLLINQGSVLSTDQIIDELWGDSGGPDRQSALWVHVSNLRSELEPDRKPRSEGSLVLTRSPGYLLDVREHDVDAARFEQLVAEGRHALQHDPEAAASILGLALELWRGRAYEEFSYESFAQSEIARLDELRLHAVETRIEADLASGMSSELVSELETLTRQHPLRERFTGQLMVASYRAGRRAEALRSYEALRKRLVDELGVEPARELQQLEGRILQDDPTLAGARVSGRSAGSSTPGLGVRGYEIREEIRQSPVGVVHRAFQPAMGREVAITTVRAEVADDPDFIRHSGEQLRLVASLEHPHLVPPHDYWREPGAAYLVNPLLRGGRLVDIMADGALADAEVVRLLGEVGGALAVAHRHGLVHGGITAESIVLDETGAGYLAGLDLGRAAQTLTSEPVESPTIQSDVAAFATVAGQAITGLSGSFQQLEGALATPVAAVLRNAIRPGDGPIGVIQLIDSLLEVMDKVESESPHALVEPIENPYRGLSAFDAGDEAVFYGRQRVIERLVTRLGEPGTAARFIAVVGPSGSGKSSVVRAGLLPALSANALPQSAEWFITSMTPSSHPFEALEAALLRIAVDPPHTLLEQLAAGENGLRRAARQILPDDGSQLLLVIDQFEEVFTLAEPEIVAAFLDGLAGAVNDAHSRVRVVITLRADFYDGPLRHLAFGELLRDGTEVIIPMSAVELEQAITKPVRPMGIEYEPSLVAEIIGEVVGQPGALPLLQYALTELFEARTGRTITIQAYQQIGGVLGALAARAESIYASGDEQERHAVQQIFLRLVALGEGANDTRRRVLTSELTDLPIRAQTALEVLERFSAHRLVTYDRDPVTRGPTVEISHEALLTEWERLEDWIDSARDTVRQQRRLRAAMVEWVEADRADDHLLTGGSLARLAAALDDDQLELSNTEREFLSKSVERREEVGNEAAAREERLVRAQGQAQRRLRLTLITTAVALGVAVLSAVALLQSRAAQQSRQELAATLASQQLAAASMLELQRDTPLSTRLALEAAFRTVEYGTITPEALDALHWAIQESNLTYPADDSTPVAVRSGPGGSAGVFAIAPDEVIRLAQSAELGRFSPEDCEEFFSGATCPPTSRSFPTGLQIQGGDAAYGVVASGPGALGGTRVEVVSAFIDEIGLFNEFEQFERDTGILITSPAGDAEVELNRRRLDMERLPDVAFWPAPGAMAEQDPTSLIDLGAYLDLERLTADFGETLISLGTISDEGSWPAERGRLYGLVADVDMKGLVYYPRAKFEASGYEIPTTWDELLSLSDQIVADGRTPWCFHFDSGGPFSGWPGTDLLETLVLREGGPDFYDAWTRHDIPFNDPVVLRAGSRLETLLLTDGYARGGPGAISRLNFFVQGLDPIVAQEPDCWLLHQGDFLFSTLPPSATAGEDVDIFPFPPIGEDEPLPTLGGGSLMSVLADRPEIREFVKRVASPTWGTRWAAHTQSSFVSANTRFDPGAYGTEASPMLAATRRRIGDATRASLSNNTWRFDASDLMPKAIGSVKQEKRGAFYQGMLDVVDGRRTMHQVLDDIEDAWQDL